MTKPDLLKLMRLLSGVESILMYSQLNTDQRRNIPDYLIEDLGNCAEMLEREILKPEAK